MSDLVLFHDTHVNRELLMLDVQKAYDELSLRSSRVGDGCIIPRITTARVRGVPIDALEVAVMLRAGGPWEMQKSRLICGNPQCIAAHHVELENKGGDWIPVWGFARMGHLAASSLASLEAAIRNAEVVEMDGKLGRFVQVSPLLLEDAQWVLRQLEGFYAASRSNPVS